MNPADWLYPPVFIYLVPLVNAIGNAFALAERPKGSPASVAFLVPARNEAENLKRLLPRLVASGHTVIVYDDLSTDATAEVATSLGAQVVRGTQEPPIDWRGKTHACHNLQAHGIELEAEWLVYLDADIEPHEGAVDALAQTLGAAKPKTVLVSGFPQFAPGRGLEPIVSTWASWLILASCPFWIIRLSGFHGSYFANGQIMAFRRSFLLEKTPFQEVRADILEDVQLGRWLTRSGYRSEFRGFSAIFTVHMYETARDAWRGYLKNSFAIGGSSFGTLVAALLLMGLAFYSFFNPWALGFIMLSMAITLLTVRRNVMWALFTPIHVLVGAATLVASVWSRRAKKLEWKGRPLS